MEQKTINQNKLQTFLCIIALTFGVLVSAVLFSMPPVHAAVSDSWYISSNAGDQTFTIEYLYDGLSRQTLYNIPLTDSNYFYAFAYTGITNINGWNQLGLYAYSLDGSTNCFRYFFSSTIISSTSHNEQKDGSYIDSSSGYYNSIETWYVPEDYSSAHESKYHYTMSLPFFNSADAIKKYCLSGDKSGLISEPEVPDIIDGAYTYIGFSINGKTARWTDTTERSHLKDQEVEEYTRITYGFATSEDQTLNADNFIEYDQDFAVGEKQMTIPWSEIESNKKDGEFIRQINFIPCYRVPGAFYLGKGVKVFFKSDGSIDKIEYAQKQTDLNTGNMIFDSSIGYLQNVIYTEEKTHDGKGRQATFKWSTSKSLPGDAQVEIVAQNFYIEWFNKKTEENFIYKEYGEDCIYKNGSFSFNANTPVWTWLSEKEIDPFSIKTQSYGTTEYYLRIVTYNEKDSMYHYGGWVRVNVKSKDATNMPTTDVETGGFNDDSGLWNKDYDSDDSYHYSTDGKGDLTGNISVSDWEDLNINSFTWMYRNLQSMVQSLGQLPTMISSIFGFLPNQVITAISVLLIAVVLMRFLGR